MRQRKARVTVTVDRLLVQAGNEAVRSGLAESLSGWVNLALSERAAKEQRLRAMAEAIRAYEADFGEISAEELTLQERKDRAAAVVVRGTRRTPRRKSRRRGAA
jgi:hypothetical protein